ncbi:hypothetical protein LPJ78_000214 [Coemansia sp. RSA 989]|nr:hypothetical protein BX667DRAFT_327943 [Coemansia mojavensis]KAJ1742478.1 hypothetical protein LPJ68_001906 [Coemansia sp. RSA 1086]KAJ1748601.1 hypothetical protein LPJ79_004400 [Coemansia sp. RSA 1821]KAJ1868466.1 hypothetical protein LPJ78_000214 [Coemansia sp. RSA 989]KAJ1875101.1 hypothetical protein LPJ55_000912 [Coemansia sp. RSA 990]KAJ2652078.1 hypothetical protein IWW40_001275 [Coemansia sp. RSA 1250]KAJ2675174.1 hypothetical protein IWW42_001320 [Coemansia sp. RSA 1085]
MSDAHIVELETLRRQLQQLHELFAVVIDETRPTSDNPHVMPWPELLSKFNVLAGKYAILSHTVGQKHARLLKELSVVPQTRPGDIHEQNILSVLLRTKLAPEIEKEEEEVWAQVQSSAQQSQTHESLASTAMSTFNALRKRHANRVQELLQEAVPPPSAAKGDSAETKPVALEEVLSFASTGASI